MSFGAITGIFTALITLAVVGVVMTSPNTSSIISATFNGFGGSLKAALGH